MPVAHFKIPPPSVCEVSESKKVWQPHIPYFLKWFYHLWTLELKSDTDYIRKYFSTFSGRSRLYYHPSISTYLTICMGSEIPQSLSDNVKYTTTLLKTWSSLFSMPTAHWKPRQFLPLDPWVERSHSLLWTFLDSIFKAESLYGRYFNNLYPEKLSKQYYPHYVSGDLG